VLHAIGIASQLATDGVHWSLIVAPQDAHEAVVNLRRYERENAPVRRFVRAEGSHPFAWVGAVTYAMVLLLVAFLGGYKYFGADWLDAGALRTQAVRSGEIWRAVTALTLHFDVAHLLGNLGFGMFFGLLAGQLMGPGAAWGGAIAAARWPTCSIRRCSRSGTFRPGPRRPSSQCSGCWPRTHGVAARIPVSAGRIVMHR
jgi:rhomboid protease GluP